MGPAARTGGDGEPTGTIIVRADPFDAYETRHSRYSFLRPLLSLLPPPKEVTL